ncbi:MAG: choice-of-anchor Q domain-containing protein [Alcanivoracaceae bacterium]
MFHRSSILVATLVLSVLSVSAWATNYSISTRDDVIAEDGFCSLREALLAINTQRGHIGGHFTDVLGVELSHSGGNLAFTKSVINVSRGSQLVTAGERLVARRGDTIEYRITVRARVGFGDAEGVTIGYLFPDQNPLFPDFKGYKSTYLSGSTTLNGSAVEDLPGLLFPLSGAGLEINSPKGLAEDSPDAVPGLIREGASAQVVFQIQVQKGDNEVTSEDVPPPANESDIEYFVEAECPAGSLSNSIFLKSFPLSSDESAVEYILVDGELSVGGGLNLAGNSVSPVVRIEPRKETPFDNAAKKNVEIIASTGSRVFRVFPGASLLVYNTSMVGNPDDNDIGPQDGGLVFTEGALEVGRGAILSGGRARSGGAIYAGGNRNVSFEVARFENNEASEDGGAIATSPDFEGSVSGARFHFYRNVAGSGAGGAIHLADTPNRIALLLVNGTFYGNQAVDGSAMRVGASARVTRLNNITIAGNDGGVALSYGITTAMSDSLDQILNSVILGNEGGDCAADDGPAMINDGSTLDVAQIEYVVSAGASCGPLDEQFASDDPLETIDYAFADYSLLVGVDPASPGSVGKFVCDPSLPGSVGCLPRVFEGGFIGFLPNNAPRAFGAPSVFGFGSPEDAVGPNVCESRDQRDLDREPRCDAGAIELQIAAGVRDEFVVVQGVRSVVDVAKNDIGDLDIDCGRLAFVDPADGGPFNPEVDCVVFPLMPSRGVLEVLVGDGVMLSADGEVVPLGYPMVHYTSVPAFHGVDQFRYTINRFAVIGDTYAGVGPSANVNLVVQPASGLTSKENISTLSGAGGFGLIFGVAMMILRWRQWFGRQFVLAAVSLLAIGAVGAAEIRVNSLADNDDIDGFCTLREALRASIDRSPFFVPDCMPGATGRDRIVIEVEGTIQLDAQLVVENSLVDIEGLGPEKTTISGNGLDRLILASSGMTLRNLTLEGGASAGNGGAIFTNASLTLDNVVVRDSAAAGSGGAIYLNYNSDLRRSVLLRRSHFVGNSAGSNGGVLSMVGQNQRHDIRIESSTFETNSAAQAGGALDINLPKGGSLRVINSTFSGNSAAEGAAMDLQQLDSSVTAYILNSTILNDPGAAAGAIELGDTLGNVQMSNSVYAGSGDCSSGSALLKESYYNLFDSVIPLGCIPAVPAASQSNDVAALSDIEAVLNGAVLSGYSYSADGAFIPPHFPVLILESGNPAFPLLVDAGNSNLDLAAGDGTPRACRSLDLRGQSRLSGGVCDRGAYELQVPTAIDDQGGNQIRFDRRARVNVLANDLVGDGVPDGAGGTAANIMLRGAIDLDPDTVATTGLATFPRSNGTGNFTVKRVPNGTWSFDHSAVLLSEGEYDLVALLRDRSGRAVASARQTVYVRSSAVPLESDRPSVVSSSLLSIDGLQDDDGPDSNDFITTNGALRIFGTSDAENGVEIELFIDEQSIGRTLLTASESACGGEPGSPQNSEDCIVLFDPGPLTCEELKAGVQETFSYRFHSFNDVSGLTVSEPAEVSVRIVNVPPQFKSRTVNSRAGESVVFDLDAIDPDGDLAFPEGLPLDLTSITMREAPKFAAVSRRVVQIEGVDEERFLVFGVEGVGAIDSSADGPVPGLEGLGLIVDPVARTVTYTPRTFETEFNDRFVLSIADECGSETAAEFRVVYPNRNKLAGGVTFWALLFSGLLLIRRRS